jgi:hypothetical protein
VAGASERWWFVVGGEQGLALSFFVGDEFGALAPFLSDAVASVLFAGLFAARHHHIAIGLGSSRVGTGRSPVDCASAGSNMPPRVRWCRCVRSER